MPNYKLGKDTDSQKATQGVYRTAQYQSHVKVESVG